MATWPWKKLPVALERGLRSADLDVLGPFEAWLQENIPRGRHYHDDADLAEEIEEELRRLISTDSGRRRLRATKDLPAFLETVTDRLRRATTRARKRYERALAGLVRLSRVPRPTEHLEGLEVATVIARAIEELSPTERKILSLLRAGCSRRQVARTVWHKSPLQSREERVKAILEAVRARLREVLERSTSARFAPRPKK